MSKIMIRNRYAEIHQTAGYIQELAMRSLHYDEDQSLTRIKDHATKILAAIRSIEETGK